MSIVAELSSFITNTDLVPANSALAKSATRALIDTTGVGLLGTREELWPIASRLAPRLYSGAGNAEVWGTSSVASPSHAAWLNGLAAHALDFDDVCTPMRGHPSAVIIPTALAVAQDTHSSGIALLDAYAVGFEIATQLGAHMGYDHYEKGWHPTFTVGVMGACAATSRLLHLNDEQVRTALGIAASFAGGLRLNFGTMTKPLHAGEAAQSGIKAAYLATEGLSANSDIFAGRIGFHQIFDAEYRDVDTFDPPLGIPWTLLDAGIDVKKYPCCYMAHRAIDACLELTAKYDINPDRVVEVLVETEPGGQSALIYDRPETALQGKFSLQYMLASALIDRRVNIDTFSDAQVQRPQLRHMFAKISNDQNHPEHLGTLVRIILDDGTVLENTVRNPHGSPANPLSDLQIDAKFLECASYVMPTSQAESLLAHLWSIKTEQSCRIFQGYF